MKRIERLAAMGIVGMAVFTAFAEDAYVESDGTQAVNTGYFANPGTKVVIDYTLLDVTTVQQRLFGSNRGLIFQHYVNGSKGLSFALQDGTGDWTAFSPQYMAAEERHVFTLDAATRTATIVKDGAQVATRTTSAQVTQASDFPLTLLADGNNALGTAFSDQKAKARLYSCQIYDHDELVRDFRPCLVDGRYALKDAVSGLVYGPVAGHAFAGGGDAATDDGARTWTGAAGTADWLAAANWQTTGGGSAAPGYGCSATIPAGSTVDAGGVTAACRALSLTGSGTVTFTATPGGALAETLALDAGVTLALPDGARLYVPAATRGGTALAAGVYTAADGWISGGGALYVNASRMEVEDGVLVLDVPGGRSETYATPLAASITKVVKRGAGEATLSAATTAFTGQTVVEAGTLVITDRAALGSGTPITVEKGGTFWPKLAHPDGNQGTAVFKDHTVTIAGDGADGCGAFRYSQTNSGNADGLLSRLVLSDDASIECARRWGMNAENDVIELNGHTLTRFGGDNLCLYNTMRAGTFLNTTGTLTFQSTAKFPDGADTTLVVTNVGTLSLWSQNAAHPIQAAVRLYTGRTLVANAGMDNAFNGPIHIAKYGPANGTVVEAYLDTKAATAIKVNGPLTSDTGLDYDHHCRFVKTGGGTLWLNGPADLEGNVYVSDGTFAMTSGATRVFRSGFSMRDGATALLAAGTLNLGFLRVANGGNVKSRFRQTGGTLQCTSADAPRIGESANGQGYYTLEGGAAHFSNTVYIAEWANSFGAFRQKGGFFEMKNTGVMYAGCRGTGLFVQTGGTNDTLVTRGGQSDRFTMNWTNGVSEVTVRGTGTVFKTERFVMGSDRSLSTNIFNLSDGALFRANRFRPKENRIAGSMACVNVDGGTMQPTFGWGWNGIDPTAANFFKACPEHFVVWKKGFVFDTSCTGEATGSSAESMPPFHYESPTGQGVERVVLPQVAATNTAYMGIARIVFQGDGWGASAYADYDFDAHKLTHVVVTSRGCDWGAGTKAFVESPDRKALWECELTLTSNEGHAGELVKRGAYNLNLYATNTITGGIAVEQGALNAHVAGAIPSNTPVRVEAGATLNLFEHPVVLSTFTGAGSVTGGGVTVTNALRASCAELFAGRHATFANALTFAEGAVFEITDPENLETYAKRGSVTAFTAQTVSGTPTLRIADGYTGSTKWSLFKSGAGSYNFGPVIGTMLLLK